MPKGVYVRSKEIRENLSGLAKEGSIGFQKGCMPWNKNLKTGLRDPAVGEKISKVKNERIKERVIRGEPAILCKKDRKAVTCRTHNYMPYFCDCGCGQICGIGYRYAHGHNPLNTTEHKREKARIQFLGNKFSVGRHPWNYGKKLGPEPTWLTCKRFLAMGKIFGEGYFYNTPSEIEMKRCLKELGIHYEFQYFVENIKHAYYADFYLPLYNIVLEVDGSIHSFKNKDDIRTKELEEVGYRVLRFNNGEFDVQSVWREI